MSIKSSIAKIYAKITVNNIQKWMQKPVETQQQVLQSLVQQAKNTAFGVDHKFDSIQTYEQFKQQVPLADYEALSPYIQRVTKGEENVLWPGLPIYFCKTSGTTSGTKYIPISKESIHNHIDCAKNALLFYVNETGNAEFLNGKMIFLQGSPVLSEIGGIPLGRLSGIVAHHVPAYLQRNRMPSYTTNCIDDWETKVTAIAQETAPENMTLISGIPSWVQMYFEKLIQLTGKENVSKLFPNFQLFVYGGVNYKPYEQIFYKLIGRKINSIETYPASEGFIAYQNQQNDPGLLLVLNKGIFYEFIPTSEIHNDNPSRLSIGQVELGVNYAIVLNTNAGLWGYIIGDTVKFVSLNPYKIIVTGRIKHYTSAFGEHVIGEEVEWAMQQACAKHNVQVKEFHVAPQVEPPTHELPYHEWAIEFEKTPQDFDAFRRSLDEFLQQKNVYYKDLIVGKVLQQLKIKQVKNGVFTAYMKSIGKLGGQNKLPRLANDRTIINQL